MKRSELVVGAIVREKNRSYGSEYKVLDAKGAYERNRYTGKINQVPKGSGVLLEVSNGVQIVQQLHTLQSQEEWEAVQAARRAAWEAEKAREAQAEAAREAFEAELPGVIQVLRAAGIEDGVSRRYPQNQYIVSAEAMRQIVALLQEQQ
jgi:hypothetical protein